MDERSPVETLGVDEETDQSINSGKTEWIAARSADSLPAGRIFAERAEDLKVQGTQRQEAKSGKVSLTGKGSVVARLKEKKSDIAAATGNPSVRLRPEPAL